VVDLVKRAPPKLVSWIPRRSDQAEVEKRY